MFLFLLGLLLGAASGYGTWYFTGHTLLAAAAAVLVAVITWTIRKAVRWAEEALSIDLAFFNPFD